jgi:hypothetical protein
MSDLDREESTDLDDDEVDFRPRPRGSLSLSLVVLGVGLSAYLLYDMRDDFSYWLSQPIAVDLGADGIHPFDKFADNIYATVHGSPGPVADRFTSWNRSFELVALRGTPILVRRTPTDADLPLTTGKPPPPPDQAPLRATGRLLIDGSILSYSPAFETLVNRGGAVPREGHLWILLDGERPRSGLRIPALFSMLTAVLVFNVGALIRYFRRRSHRSAQL